MRKRDVEKIRMDLGSFLHTYYIKFGEEKYEKFLEKLGPVMEHDYGEPFSKDNLRIMEAEYVALNYIDNHGTKSKEDKDDKENITE